jgi:hypothetical protein
MFHELMTEIRHVRDSVSKVHEALDRHVHDEDSQYSELREDNQEIRETQARMREDISSLNARWGVIAGVAAVVGGGIMALFNKVFF